MNLDEQQLVLGRKPGKKTGFAPFRKAILVQTFVLHTKIAPFQCHVPLAPAYAAAEGRAHFPFRAINICQRNSNVLIASLREHPWRTSDDILKKLFCVVCVYCNCSHKPSSFLRKYDPISCAHVSRSIMILHEAPCSGHNYESQLFLESYGSVRFNFNRPLYYKL